MSKARALLARARTLDEVLNVRRIASGAEKYFKAAHHSRHIAQEAAEIRLRSERRAGEMLIEMEQRGERRISAGAIRRSHAVTLTLPVLGIERMQAMHAGNT